MPNRPPEYCSYCGGPLESVDPPTVHRCDACAEHVFYNPVPTARVAVLDEDAILLVRVPDWDLWGTPGGMVEAGEDPDVAGARELREETTLEVDPDALALFDARTFVKFEATHKTSLSYAVDVDDVSGTPRAADEVAEARFWTPAELDAAAEDRLLTSWPEAHTDLAWWVEHASRALDES